MRGLFLRASVFRGLRRFISNGLIGYPSLLPVAYSPDPRPPVQRPDPDDFFPRVYVQFPGAVIFQHHSLRSALRMVNQLNGNPASMAPAVFRPNPVLPVFLRRSFPQHNAFPLFQPDGMFIFRPV